MKRCTTCRRHIRREEPSCPFCGRRFGQHVTLAAVALTVGVTGCGPERAIEDSGALETEDGSATRSDSGEPVTSTNPGSTTSIDPDPSGATDSDEPQTTSAGFIYGSPGDDGGVPHFECDVWTQDCPPGTKCAPWDNSGQGAWNATKCVPVHPNPAQPGERCHAEGSGVSGIDDCDLGSICWNVDPATLEGVCVAQCEGSEANPSCADGFACYVPSSGALNLCLQICDPLMQNCLPNEVCFGIGAHFLCVPHYLGSGGYGEPCDGGACDPGFHCAPAQSIPECQGAAGCCTAYCDVTDAGAEAACAAYSPTLTCVPLWRPGTAPEGYEHLGTCLDPS